MLAAKSGHLEIVDYLVEIGANLRISDHLFATAYELAWENNQKQIIDFFDKFYQDELINNDDDPRWMCPYCGAWGWIGAREPGCDHFFTSDAMYDNRSEIYEGPVGKLLSEWNKPGRKTIQVDGAPICVKRVLELLRESGDCYWLAYSDQEVRAWNADETDEYINYYCRVDAEQAYEQMETDALYTLAWLSSQVEK
jgi:hypothetical protein